MANRWASSRSRCNRYSACDVAGRTIVEAARRIRDGERPSEALRGLVFLSPAYVWFLAGSEERGDFLDVTRAMTETAEERLTIRLEAAERLLEPVATVLLGLVVGAVVVGLYEAMFTIIAHVGNS